MADQEEQTTSTPNTDINSNWAFIGIRKVKGYFQEIRAKRKQENSTDRAVRSTANATWVIALLTIATIGVGISQYIIFGRQLDVMENDKRPWLNADISLNNRVNITEWGATRGIDVPLKFAMKNYGQVPAINVRVNVRAWPHPGNPRRAEVLPLQKRTCEDGIATADKDPTGGVAVFPSESTTIDADANLSGGGIYKDGEPVLWAIYGCLDYTYGGGRHGQTGFNYLPGKNIGGQLFGVPFVEGKARGEPPTDEQIKAGFPKDSPKTAEIPVSEVWFMAADSGNYAK